MIARRTLLLASPALALLGANCAPPPPPPAVVDLTIRGGRNQNPDPTGTPVPVAVRLYSLNATSKFSAADAIALMQRDRALLGEESAGIEELIVRPGETKALSLSPRPTVRFLGVAVLFRDIDSAEWRALAPIRPSGPTKLALTIEGKSAKLTPV